MFFHHSLIESSKDMLRRHRSERDEQAQLVRQTRAAIAYSWAVLARAENLLGMTQEPTPEQLADQFAANAVQAVLERAPDGLNVLEELAQRPKKTAA